MYGFTPIISDDHVLIVGYGDADGNAKTAVYRLPVAISQHQLMDNTTVPHPPDGLN